MNRDFDPNMPFHDTLTDIGVTNDAKETKETKETKKTTENEKKNRSKIAFRARERIKMRNNKKNHMITPEDIEQNITDMSDLPLPPSSS